MQNNSREFILIIDLEFYALVKLNWDLDKKTKKLFNKAYELLERDHFKEEFLTAVDGIVTLLNGILPPEDKINWKP